MTIIPNDTKTKGIVFFGNCNLIRINFLLIFNGILHCFILLSDKPMKPRISYVPNEKGKKNIDYTLG